MSALAKALVAAQAEFPPIERSKDVRVQTKTGGSYSFSYAPLDAILNSVRPVLTKHGLAVSQLLGHIDGVELVSPARRATMAAVAFTGMDEVMGFPTSWAYGYSPARPSGRGKPGSVFGMIGMNGSAAYADIDSGVAVAVMRNRFTGDFTTIERIDRLIEDELA